MSKYCANNASCRIITLALNDQSFFQPIQLLIFIGLFILFVPTIYAADTTATQRPAQSIAELQQRLEKILKDTHTPGASIAIVHHDGPEWVAGLGLADVANNHPVTPEVLFRIGSVSKGFTALAILLLVDQGKLSLNDPVRKLAPEVWFENRWEATNPVRVVNLLEHTTGWDDLSLRDNAKDNTGMKMYDALDFSRHSRICRWRPGTRMAYCNTGPWVAGYIVEKLTNQRFEDFVEQNLFLPIGMKTATYFQPSAGLLTMLYHNDGKTPYPYWNVPDRPSGSINASAQDMAAYLQFYLNRGMTNGKQVVPASDIDRMEVPASTWAAKQGLKTGYGLANAWWKLETGFIFHGHNGGLEGGLTEMAYTAEHDMGYFFSINSGNWKAYDQISSEINRFITRKLQKPPLPPMQSLAPDAAEYAGWYEPSAPRNQQLYFISRLKNMSLVNFKNGRLLLSSLDTWNDTLLPVTDKFFRYVPKKGPAEPVASVALIAPNEDGRFIQIPTTSETFRHIPAWLAIVELVLTLFALLSFVSIIIYYPFWILGGLSKKRRRPAERAMRIWPLLAVLSVAAALGIGFYDEDVIARLGNLTPWSAAIFLATIMFAVASIASAIAVWRARGARVRKGIYLYSIIITLALLIATAYFAYWGVIGLRTWG